MLSGRYISFEIFPFSFTEYCLTTGKNQDKSAFLGYLTSGSMPELFNLPMPKTRVHYVQNLKNTIVFKDNTLSNYFEPGLGYLLENFVFLKLRRNGYTVFTGSDQNREVDFVAVKNGVTRYIQVCYLITGEDVVKREFGNLETIKDNYEKMVISIDDISLVNRNGIIHAVAWNTEIYR